MGPFYIRRLKRRPWRALCALLLCAAFAALLCRLASQASAQRAALANVHEHMDVRCTISNVQGTSTSHLRMGNGYLWRVQDPEGMLTPYIRDLQLTKEFYYISQALQVDDGVLTGVTDPCCADVLDPDLGAEVTYFVQDFFDSDAAQCLVPEAFYQQLGEGGRLTLQVMDPLGDGQRHTYACTVAGFYLGAGTEIFLSWPCAERLMEDISETLSCDSMTFFARDNRQLSALAEAAATTFCPVDPTGSFTIFMYAMTVHDSQYLETVDALETNIRRTQLLIPALLLGALAAGFLSSYLAMRGERRSFALMRAVGMPRGRLTLAILAEQLLPPAIGCATAILWGNVLAGGVLLLCTVLGIGVGAIPIFRLRPAALLSKRGDFPCKRPFSASKTSPIPTRPRHRPCTPCGRCAIVLRRGAFTPSWAEAEAGRPPC